MRLLVVDDDPGLLAACRVGLAALGHAVATTQTGAEALAAVAVDHPDAVVLDLGLPDLDGMEVCRRLRTFSPVPVVVLSADGSEDRKVEALTGGADDYVTKPFGMRELEARLQVAHRHRRGAEATAAAAELDVGPLHLDLVHREATLDGRPLDLTNRELDVLAVLARNVGRVVTRRMLLEEVWGPAYRDESRYLKVYAYRLRRKLGDDAGAMLQSDPSVGYRLVDPGP